MALTKDEEATIQNVIARLKEPSCGGVSTHIHQGMPDLPEGFEPVSRVYLTSWIIPALEMLLPGEQRDPKLARKMSRK